MPTMEKNLISLASKATELANKIIVTKLEENGIKGIVPSHGGILHLLYLNKKVTMKEVSEFINKTKPTVTVLVDKLIGLDFICKTKSDNDSRVTYLTLTQKGESLEPIFKQISDELNELVYKNLTLEESTIVETILLKVINSLNS